MRADSIFSTSFGNRPSRLIGREAVLAAFMAGLDSAPGSRDRAIVVLGQRGSGKTVLLWELADRAAEAGFVVASPTVASEYMLERIIEKIRDNAQSRLKKRKRRIAGGSIGALGFSAGLQFAQGENEQRSFSLQLTNLARELTRQNRGILILVDELQANSPEVRQLVIAYQELVGEGLNVALVMAGLPGAVSATLNDRVLTFLNCARKVELGSLALGDIDSFFLRAFEESGLRISDDLRIRAARATQGSPYLLQLIGHNIATRTPDDGFVDADVVAGAIRAAQADFENDVCKTTLAALSGKDVEFLRAMACDEEVSRMRDIAARMDVTPDYAQKYRKRLMDAGVVEASSRGSVAFAVPYLADYLRKEGDAF